MTIRRDPDGRWRFRVVVRKPDGTRERISGTAPKHDNTKPAAQQAERDAIALALRGGSTPAPAPALDPEVSRVPVAAPVTSEPRPSFRDFVAEHMTTYAVVHNQPSERASKQTICRDHLLPALGDLALDEVGVREIETLKRDLLARKALSPKTVNNILDVLSKTLHYARDLDMVGSIPRIRKLRTEKPAIVYLDFDEWDRLVARATATASPWLLPVLLAGDAGLRHGEICALSWDAWDAQAGRLVVSRAEWRGIEGPTKGKKVRMVPTTPRLAQALAAGRAASDGRGRVLGGLFLGTRVQKLCREARIKAVGWHGLRHTFCTHLAQLGAPARVIQELAGHADLRTTLRYLHLTRGAADQAIDLFAQRLGVAKTCQTPFGTTTAQAAKS